MTETAIIIATGNFIATCAGVGGGWRRIAHINVSAEVTAPLDGVKTLTQMLVSAVLQVTDDKHALLPASLPMDQVTRGCVEE